MNEFANSKENGVRKRDEAVFLDGIEVRKGITDANGKEFVDDKAKPEAKILEGVTYEGGLKGQTEWGVKDSLTTNPFEMYQNTLKFKIPDESAPMISDEVRAEMATLVEEGMRATQRGDKEAVGNSRVAAKLFAMKHGIPEYKDEITEPELQMDYLTERYLDLNQNGGTAQELETAKNILTAHAQKHGFEFKD